MSSSPSNDEKGPISAARNGKMDQEDDDDELTDREQAMLRELQRRQDRVDEMERRQKVTMKAEEQEEEGHIPDPEIAKTQILKSKFDYEFAIVNKGHRGLNPPCKRPAFRILGLFRNKKTDFRNWMDDLQESKMIYLDEKDGQTKCKLGDLHKLPLLKYMLIPKTRERERDEEYTTKKIEEIKRIYLEHEEMARNEFEENMVKRSQGKMGLSLEKKRENAKKKSKHSSGREKALEFKEKQQQKEAKENNSIIIREVARVPRIMELRGQQFAIIILLMDVTPKTLAGKDDPEPAVMVIDTFLTCEEAEAYMETLKHYIFCMSMFVVDMYEWHYPEDIVLDDIKEKYRHPEQNKVMQDKKFQKVELEKYINDPELAGMELTPIEVNEKSKMPENFRPLKEQPKAFSHVESSEPVDREKLKEDYRKDFESPAGGGGGASSSGTFRFDISK